MFSHFDTKMDNIQSGLQTLQGLLSTLGDHVSELEQSVSSNVDNLTELQKQVKTFLTCVTKLRMQRIVLGHTTCTFCMFRKNGRARTSSASPEALPSCSWGVRTLRFLQSWTEPNALPLHYKPTSPKLDQASAWSSPQPPG